MIKRTQLSLNNSFHSPEFPTGQNSLKFNKVSKLFLHSYFYFCRRLEKTGEKVKFQRSLIVSSNSFYIVDYNIYFQEVFILHICCLYNLRGTRVQLSVPYTIKTPFQGLHPLTLSHYSASPTFLLH